MRLHSGLIVTGIAVALMISEVTIHVLGLMDVPRYDADNKIGYIPKASQSGTLMLSRDWVFNNRHMGTDVDFQPSPGAILLVGDSLVMGGNWYRQAERLGPQLKRISGRQVWPIAAFSWGLQNEVQYLRDNPDVVKSVDRIIVLSNSGDFEKPSQWANPVTHPLEKSAFGLAFLAKKYVWKPRYETPESLQVDRHDAIEDFLQFATSTEKPVEVWLYKSRAEFGKPVTALQALANRVSIFERKVTVKYVDEQIPEWNASCYADEIHPTPACTEMLATAMAR